MSLPIFEFGQKPFENYDMSAVGDVTSTTIDIRNAVGYAVHTVWSGASAVTADLLVQASNDGINFVTIDTVDLDAASGNALLNVERAMYAYIRVFFDKNTETTGLLSVTLCGKRI